MLKVSNLSAGYGDLQVLREVNLQLRPHGVSVLMGPNGAGKSTLLKAVYGLAKITEGEIRYQNKLINNIKTYELSSLGIAYLPQGRVNFDSLTVEENLLMGALRVKNVKVVHERLSKIYKELPMLYENKSELAYKLSGGQQQILAISRVMLDMPEIVLLDEPSLGLSPKLIKQVFDNIRLLNRVFGTTFLLVEHNIKSVLNITDYCYVMSSGRIMSHGNVDKMEKSKVLRKVFMGEYE